MEDGRSTVVVGVDGSPPSRAALAYGLGEAARRGCPVRVVAATPLPDYWAGAYGYAPPLLADEVVGAAREQAQELVDEVLAAHPDLAVRVPVSVEAAAGRAGEVLVAAADGADLLVVGHRGRGAVRSALLGSVGLHCVLHAPCPVTVVRPAEAAEGALDGSPPVAARS